MSPYESFTVYPCGSSIQYTGLKDDMNIIDGLSKALIDIIYELILVYNIEV